MKWLGYIFWLMIYAPGVKPQTWRQFYDWDKDPRNKRKLAAWAAEREAEVEK